MLNLRQSFQKVNNDYYSTGLLLTPFTKTISAISKKLNIPYHTLHKHLDKHTENIESMKVSFEIYIQKLFRGRKVLLIIDDTTIAKIYAEKIEGIGDTYDSAEKRVVKGITTIVAILTDGVHVVPLSADLHFTKKILQDHYKSKSAQAQELIEELKQICTIDLIVADGHYSTIELLTYLSVQQIDYLMKFARNRKVVVRKKCLQVQDAAALMKNKKSTRVKCNFQGVECYIYAVRLSFETTNYYISSKPIDRKKVLDTYKKRWIIECFFRTAKQKLGLKECQAIKAEKQLLHVFNVFKAYQIADQIKNDMHFNNVDQAINYIRSLNREEQDAIIEKYRELWLVS